MSESKTTKPTLKHTVKSKAEEFAERLGIPSLLARGSKAIALRIELDKYFQAQLAEKGELVSMTKEIPELRNYRKMIQQEIDSRRSMIEELPTDTAEGFENKQMRIRILNLAQSYCDLREIEETTKETDREMVAKIKQERERLETVDKEIEGEIMMSRFETIKNQSNSGIEGMLNILEVIKEVFDLKEFDLSLEEMQELVLEVNTINSFRK